jgi:hypothetical protein
MIIGRQSPAHFPDRLGAKKKKFGNIYTIAVNKHMSIISP